MTERDPNKQTRPARKVVLLLAVLCSLCLVTSLAHAGVRIASWNCKHLGWNNHKDLPAMARIIDRFDLVALQEVMHPVAAQRLARLVQQASGEPWGVMTSRAVGDGAYKEGYAFLWRKSAVQPEGGAVLYLDPDNDFLRQPFSARFRALKPASSPVFVAATVHIRYGDKRSDRTPEIASLATYWEWLGQSFPGEPRLLMGDFNTSPSHRAWKPLRRLAEPVIRHGASTLSKKPGRYAHLYDNIWTDGGLDIEQRGIGYYPEWLGITHKRAYRSISDHAPVYIGIRDARVATNLVNSAAHDASTKKQRSNIASTARAKEISIPSCIDLNTASAQQLDRLNNVGASRARAIISGRPWRSLDGLTRVRGLSSGLVSEIREQHLTCMP